MSKKTKPENKQGGKKIAQQKEKKEVNTYDNILRENAPRFFKPLIEQALVMDQK